MNSFVKNKHIKRRDIFFFIVSIALLWFSYKPLIRLKNYTMWAWYSFFLMFIIPLILLLLTRAPLKDYGFSKGKVKRGMHYTIIVVSVFLPFLIYGARFPEFQNYYPRYPNADSSLLAFLYWEFLFFIYLLGWEYFFRGFLLFTLEKYTGWWSVVIQALPFTILHIGKPFPEVYSSFFAGIILGYICIKAKSFWPALFVHWIISVIFDVLVIVL